MSAELISTRRDNTLILTLSKPGAHNRLDSGVIAAVIEALSTAERDHAVRVVILTGADQQFCGGDSVLALPQQDGAGQAEAIAHLHSLIESILDCPIPVIAAVEGLAAGAGFSLALACDLIVATPSARFVVAGDSAEHAALGGAAWFLSRALPRQLATELLLQEKALSGERLHALGLVNRLADSSALLDEALNWADELATLPPAAMETIKAQVSEARNTTLQQHFNAEKNHFFQSMQGRRESGELRGKVASTRPGRAE